MFLVSLSETAAHFLRYIIFELLKNVSSFSVYVLQNKRRFYQAMSAIYTKHMQKTSPPPIQVTIVAGENDVAIRISDQGKCSYQFCYFQSLTSP